MRLAAGSRRERDRQVCGDLVDDLIEGVWGRFQAEGGDRTDCPSDRKWDMLNGRDAPIYFTPGLRPTNLECFLGFFFSFFWKGRCRKREPVRESRFGGG